MKKICVRVPATSANCGPGFDSLGLALDLYNEFIFVPCKTSKEYLITYEGLGAELLEQEDPQCNLVVKAMELLFKTVNQTPIYGTIHSIIRIPPSRGLGSSATAIVGGLMIGNALLQTPLTKDELLLLATTIEGHPDNVCPALFGNLCLSKVIGDEILYTLIPVGEELFFTTTVPDQPLSTAKARSVLPCEISYKGAVENTTNMGLLIAAFLQKRYDILSYAMEDYLHVPYRLPLIQGGGEALAAAKAAGALGATISGAGSTLIAYSLKDPDRIGKAMVEAFIKVGFSATYYILKANKKGAYYVK